MNSNGFVDETSPLKPHFTLCRIKAMFEKYLLSIGEKCIGFLPNGAPIFNCVWYFTKDEV